VRERPFFQAFEESSRETHDLDPISAPAFQAFASTQRLADGSLGSFAKPERPWDHDLRVCGTLGAAEIVVPAPYDHNAACAQTGQFSDNS
jgi:hypothetical protein